MNSFFFFFICGFVDDVLPVRNSFKLFTSCYSTKVYVINALVMAMTMSATNKLVYAIVRTTL